MPKPGPGSAGTRERILDAAAEVMRTRGLAKATTKEIARESGFSEAALYKHFDGKEELFVRVLLERIPQFGDMLKALPELVGTGAIHDHLAALLRQAVHFYGQTVPIAASIFAEPALLARQRQAVGRMGAGPQHANEALTDYLRAEQAIGRIRADVLPEAGASLLLGACYQRAFFACFMGEDVGEAVPNRFADDLVHAFLAGSGA